MTNDTVIQMTSTDTAELVKILSSPRSGVFAQFDGSHVRILFRELDENGKMQRDQLKGYLIFDLPKTAV